VESLETRFAVQENIVTASIGGLSFLLAWKHPARVGRTYFLLAPVLTIHGTLYESACGCLPKRDRSLPASESFTTLEENSGRALNL